MKIDLSSASFTVDGMEASHCVKDDRARVYVSVENAPGAAGATIREWDAAIRSLAKSKQSPAPAEDPEWDARRSLENALAEAHSEVTHAGVDMRGESLTRRVAALGELLRLSRQNAQEALAARDAAKAEVELAQKSIQQAHAAFGEAFGDPTATVQQKAAQAARLKNELDVGAAKVKSELDALRAEREDLLMTVKTKDDARGAFNEVAAALGPNRGAGESVLDCVQRILSEIRTARAFRAHVSAEAHEIMNKAAALRIQG